MTPENKSEEAGRRARLAHLFMMTTALTRWTGSGHLCLQQYIGDDLNAVDMVSDPPKVVVICGRRRHWFTLHSAHSVLKLSDLVGEDALCRFISSLCSG